MESNVETEAVGARQWCVVYETRSRRVVHVHEFVAAGREYALTDEELAEAALAQVSNALPPQDLAVAFPDSAAEPREGMEYQVDDGSGRVRVVPDRRRFISDDRRDRQA